MSTYLNKSKFPDSSIDHSIILSTEFLEGEPEASIEGLGRGLILEVRPQDVSPVIIHSATIIK
jgi:hypothetical protein